MGQTAIVRARIEPVPKEHAEAVFQQLGLNPAQAITVFCKQVGLRRGLPFDVANPTTTTKRTFKPTDAGRDLVVCEGEEILAKLGI
ncbi:MAG: type II toxin-antitoxin system RelB/DinJ family antitoxin [Candidatus Handelsmanbacteria bacterium]|nr:type II toxin-antitoxin system RelB/DinJ family antitoxin [Candidatus Handelsmanbacteria bacterium]